ncbi:membrane protein containing DUF214, permase predicted, partial [mine drainage metagenome]
SSEIGVRRALGASRRAIFMQLLIESGLVGLAGGMLGLLLTLLGLWAVRQQPSDYAKLASLDPAMLLATFVLALLGSLLAGALPAWRACLTPARAATQGAMRTVMAIRPIIASLSRHRIAALLIVFE